MPVEDDGGARRHDVTAAKTGQGLDQQWPEFRAGIPTQEGVSENVAGPGLEKRPVPAVPRPLEHKLLALGSEQHPE